MLAQVESDESLQNLRSCARPSTAIVIERRSSSGEMTGEQPLFAIADLTTLWAEFKVFPGQRAEVAIGQKVRLKADGIDREGTIRHLLPAPGNAPYTLARVEVDNAEGLLTPGLLVAGDIVVETVEAPLVVDNRALQSFRDWTVVFTQVDDTYEIRPLELGRSDGNQDRGAGRPASGRPLRGGEQLPDQGGYRKIRRIPRPLTRRPYDQCHLRLSVERRFLMLSLILVLVGVGVWSFQRLPIDAVPDITNVQVQINTEAPGYSPLEAEQRITFPVETALYGLPNLSYTRSLSRYGLSQVTVVFEEGTDIYLPAT